MTGKIHVFVGTSTLALVALTCPSGFEFNSMHIIPALGLVTATAGSLAPDIDLARSSAGMKHKTVSKIASKAGGGHRGLFHTLLVPAICVLLSYYIPAYVSLKVMSSFLGSLVFGWMFGYMMHLFMDLCNGKGIPLFWPIVRKKVHILDIPSNGIAAWIFAILCVAISYYLVFKGVFL